MNKLLAMVVGALTTVLLFTVAPDQEPKAPQAPKIVDVEPPLLDEKNAEKPFHQRSTRWPTVRAKYLKVWNTCAACGSKDKLEVHHVKPFHLFPELELDPTNFITLCEKSGHDCHFVFGHNYNWKCWNPDVKEDAGRQLNRVKIRKTE